MRKGAVIGLTAGAVLGAATGWLLCHMDEAHPSAGNCAGGMFIVGAFFGGLGAGAGVGLGALIDSQSRFGEVPRGGRPAFSTRGKRVSVGVRF